MMRTILAILLFSVTCSTANAQHTPKDVIDRVTNKANSINYVSYNIKKISKNIFSDKDTAVTEGTETVMLSKDGKVVSENAITYGKNVRPLYRSVFNEGKLYQIDLADSTYSVKLQNETSSAFTEVLDRLKKAIVKSPGKVFLKKDTIIANQTCYTIFINSYDTVERNQHNYTYLYFYINKKTLLPVYTREKSAGEAMKGGYSLGRINAFNESYFSNYEVNQAPIVSVFKFDTDGFGPENKKMLTVGTPAPDIKVLDLSGHIILPQAFKNKVVLLEFGSTTCGANPLANPLMNRLTDQYNAADVIVMAIYSDETAEQAVNYIAANHLTFPVYLGSSRLKRQFKTIGTPNFYLIDKQGIIIKSIDGYSDKLEPELDAALKKVTNR